jgi:hypothetical protein
VVSGPAKFLGLRGGTLAVPACSVTHNLFHGFDVDNRRWDLSVPVGATSVLEFPYETSPFAPWPDTSFRLTFVADPRLVDGGRGTLTERTTAPSDPPTVTGRRGVHISLRTSPATRRFRQGRGPVLRRGTRLTVRARTNPRLRRQRVDLKYIGPRSPRLRLLRSVLTDRRGRFRRTVRTPRRRGRYELWAIYKSQRGDLVSDHACPLVWRVR